MKSTTLAFLEQRLDTEADDIARRTKAIVDEVMPAGEVIAQEVQDQALLGDLELFTPLVGQLGAFGQGVSGFGVAIRAAIAQHGGQMDPVKRANVEAALLAYEQAGAQPLANLLQAVRDLLQR